MGHSLTPPPSTASSANTRGKKALPRLQGPLLLVTASSDEEDVVIAAERLLTGCSAPDEIAPSVVETAGLLCGRVFAEATSDAQRE